MSKHGLLIKIIDVLTWISPLLMGIVMLVKPTIIAPKIDLILGCLFLGYFIVETINIIKKLKKI